MIITDEVLGRINAARATRGLPPLDKQTAIKKATERRQLAVDQGSTRKQSSDFLMHFLIGYATGFPMPSVGGILGASMHEPMTAKVESVSYSRDEWKDVPATETPSSKSDDSYSSSSSSYDSGGSGGGSSDSGSSGGGGGGE